jgi:hypothetical protein
LAGLAQHVIFAAGRGQRATDLRTQRTGLFSREVLRLVADDGAALLTDPAALTARLRDRFESLRGSGLTRQTPTYLWYRNELGEEGLLVSSGPASTRDRELSSTLVEPPPAALAPIVDALLVIDEFRDPRGREEILSLLPGTLYGAIRRHAAARTDAISIVRTCLRHPGGLSELMESVGFFVGDSPSLSRLVDAVAAVR